jgi:hypothetical protein
VLVPSVFGFLIECSCLIEQELQLRAAREYALARRARMDHWSTGACVLQEKAARLSARARGES